MSTYAEMYIAMAKKDYETGTFSWFDLQRKYPQLTVEQIFRVILENRKNLKSN